MVLPILLGIFRHPILLFIHSPVSLRFTFFLRRLKIFIFIDLLLSFVPRRDLVERVQHALRLLHDIQDELVAIERVLTEDNRS